MTKEEIVAHNSSLSAEIKVLEDKRTQYETVRSQATEFVNQLEQLATGASSVGEKLENIIICGKAIDDENFKQLGAKLSSIAGEIKEIANACTTKIGEIDTTIATKNTQFIAESAATE